MTPSEFKKELDGLSGVYVFYGEEEYLKHYYLDEARKAVIPDPAFDVFNRVSISGVEGLEGLESAVSMPPMMSDRKLIELHGIRYDKLKGEELDYLCTALSLAKESGDTVVILYAEANELKADNPKRLPEYFTELLKYAAPVNFERQSPAKLVGWATKHFVHEGIRADGAECMTLVEYCNRDMSAISNEITKLCAYLKSHGRDQLSRDDIHLVCCRIDEIAAFDFANAILDGDKGRAYEILKDMFAKKQKTTHILGSIAAVYGDLYRIQTFGEAGMSSAEIAKVMRMSSDYKVKLYQRSLRGKSADFVSRALKACEEADLKLKSTPLDSFEVLASLVISQ